MFLIIFAALIAAGETAKLDRTYLPPISAATAGGGPGSLQLPFSRSNEGAPENQDIPTGGFVNNHQGVVVEAALAGTRASGPQSALGGPRISYGSSDSKVGDAAFRVTNDRFPQGPASELGPNGEPDLSAFHRPPSFKPGNIQIIRDYVSNTVKYQNNIGLDKFNYAFETDNGIKMAENGISRNGIQAQGGYSYTGDDGKVYSVVYTADKNGYRPTGNHLPTPPPIPAEILESLKQNARDEAAGLVDDGSYDAKKYNTEDNYAENEANDKYNDRQSNKFGDRPVFAGGFINQNQQAFVAPSINGQFGVNDASKDTAFSNPDSSKFGSLVQSDNRFGSIREPSKDNANNLLSNKQTENQFPSTAVSAASPDIEAKPLSQQKLQEQKPFVKPSFNRPSSYDTSNLGILSSSVGSSQPISVNSFGQSNEGPANNFGSGNNRLSGQAFQYQPTQGSFNLNANQGLPIEQSSNHNKPFSVQSTLTSSQPSTGYFTSQPTQQFPSSNIQSSQNGRLPGSQFSSSPTKSNQPVFTIPLKPSFPTKPPLTTLTTPLESVSVTNEGELFSQSDLNKKEELDNKKILTTPQEFTASLSQSSQSTPNMQGDSSTSYTGSDRPSFISLDNRFSSAQTTQSTDSTQFIQPQAPDHSYIYNRPNKPFNTPFVGTGSISSTSPNSQVTSLLPQTSFFTNAPHTLISSMKNGAVIGPQSANLSRDTQASLSFPSRVSGVSTHLNTKPSFNTPSASTFSQIIPTAMTATAQIFSIPNSETISSQGIQEIQYQDGNTSLPSQQNTEEVYQYPKPTTVLPSQGEKQNLQSGQENSASKDSSFPQFNVFGTRKPTTQQSSFNVKPHSQFFQGAFNNKGPNVPLFPKLDQQNAPQVDSDKTQNQASGLNSQPQFGQQNFPTLPKNPGQSFGSQSRPQLPEIGLFGDKGQLNLSSASQFGSKPFTSASSFSQGTSSGFNTPSILLPTKQETLFKPTEEPTSQNTQSVFNNKETTSSQSQESVQPSFPAFTKPFGFNTQKPLSQFGQQHSFSSRHPATDLTSPVISQFPFLTSKFGNKPISVGTQFGTFNTQNKLSDFSAQNSFTSKKPFSQTSPINSQESTQFNQNTLSSEQTTMFEQAGDSADDKHSTLLPSSTQFQTGSFDEQRPTTQFGQSSFSITSLKPSSQSQFGSQQGISTFGQGSFNDKESTPSQFDQSTQQFGTDLKNKLSTQMPSSSQVEYNDYNKETTNTQFNVPSSFDQFLSTNQPSQLSMLFTGQLGQDNESKTTTSTQFDNKQQTISSNEPSTLFSSTFEIQAPTQSSEFGQIYDYKKPVQGLLTPSQKPNRPQFQANIQFGQQGLLNIQKGKPAQFSQSLFNSPSSQFNIANEDKVESVTQQNSLGTFPSTQDGAFSTSQNSDQSSGEIYEYNKPSTQFGQQGTFNVQKEKPAQFTKPLFNSQFTTNEDKTETATQENILTGFPSTPEVSSSTLQNAGQNSGEIYDYNKPNKQFGQQQSITLQKENPAQFSQTSFNFASSQFSTIDDKSESVTQENILTGMPSTQDFSSTSDKSDQSTGEIYEYNKPEQSLSTSSENDGTTQFGQKIQSTSNVNREDFFTNQHTDDNQNKNIEEQTSTTSGEVNEQPRPQLAFHSACCGGLFKRPLGSNNLNPSFNIFNQNKDSIPNQKPSEVDQSIDKQNIEPEKASSFTGVGEKFPSSRKPPSFDINGYHY